MQVTCPNCRARYAVDPLAIGPSGRTVQCARCNERWFEVVKVQPAPPPSPPPVAAPVEKREPADDGKPAGAGVLSWLKPKPKVKAPKPEPTAEPPKPAAAIADDAPPSVSTPIPDVVIRPPTRGAMLPALIEPKTNRRMNLVLWGALALLVLVGAGIFAFHDIIAQQLPPEWRTILRFSG
ncbi:MAG TPA: zinc-ribbon domain-containing protein [Reyranella sp.]|jgi:predicted Zn finger-like uncharacterized protein|nr:zinc-ribbon domain-containing protein [Reyranella sp.]